MLRWFAQALEASTFLAAELLGQGHRREQGVSRSCSEGFHFVIFLESLKLLFWRFWSYFLWIWRLHRRFIDFTWSSMARPGPIGQACLVVHVRIDPGLSSLPQSGSFFWPFPMIETPEVWTNDGWNMVKLWFHTMFFFFNKWGNSPVSTSNICCFKASWPEIRYIVFLARRRIFRRENVSISSW